MSRELLVRDDKGPYRWWVDRDPSDFDQEFVKWRLRPVTPDQHRPWRGHLLATSLGGTEVVKTALHTEQCPTPSRRRRRGLQQPHTSTAGPSPGNTSSTNELLQLILERLDNIEKELKDHKRDTDRKIQDLNALIIQNNSPRRSDRPNSPTPRAQPHTP